MERAVIFFMDKFKLWCLRFLQSCVLWTMGVVVTTAAVFLGRASCALVPWAWSWDMTIRLARFKAFVPNILSVVRSVNRKNPASSVRAMRAGSWRLIWKAAKALVSTNRNFFTRVFFLWSWIFNIEIIILRKWHFCFFRRLQTFHHLFQSTWDQENWPPQGRVQCACSRLKEHHCFGLPPQPKHPLLDWCCGGQDLSWEIVWKWRWGSCQNVRTVQCGRMNGLLGV